jgi:hypothetical protein
MLLKSVTLSGIMLLCSVITNGQASFKCYRATNNKTHWVLGVRTGISREHDIDFSEPEPNTKKLSWTQQIFLQRDIGEHLMLEIQSMHQYSWKDEMAFTHQDGRIYSSAISKNERLHNNIILHYKIPVSPENLKVCMGAGAGFILNKIKLVEVYTLSGQPIEYTSTSYHVDVPNLIIALTGSYLIENKVSLSCQLSYSNLITAGISHLNMNLGMAYTLR